jgi:xylulokinase
MGVFSTLDLCGWSDELLDAVGGKKSQLPEIRDGNQIGGNLTASAARQLGLTQGTPMLLGVVDGSAAMLAAGAKSGQLLNVCGSTDVLALCTNRPRPHERLLTRALGVGRLWVSVSTIAAAGSAIQWAKEQLFADLDWPVFDKLMRKVARRGAAAKGKRSGDGPDSASVHFDPYLAGDRMSIDQKQAAFTGLTLASTRETMLAAVLDSLAQASAARLELLRDTGTPIDRRVVITGGAGNNGVFHRDWPGKWKFQKEDEATLRGLAKLSPGN